MQPKIQVASKYERRVDTRSYDDKKKLFEGVSISSIRFDRRWFFDYINWSQTYIYPWNGFRFGKISEYDWEGESMGKVLRSESKILWQQNDILIEEGKRKSDTVRLWEK